MEVNENLTYITSNIDVMIDIIKVFSIIIFTYYTNHKLINKKATANFKDIILMIILSFAYVFIKKRVNYLIGIISLTISISLIFSTHNIGKTILTTIISLSINYILSTISIIINFFISILSGISNDYFHLIMITILHMIMLYSILKIKKLKYGISFLRVKEQNESLDILALNMSAIALFSIIMFLDLNVIALRNVFTGTVLFTIIMFITIQKTFKLYYKQKLLEKELNKTKEDLANQIKDNKELEAENIEISKKAHTLDHKQKSLAKKIEEMLLRSEISTEEAAEVRERLNKIGEELYKEKSVTELTSTEIPEIDDMLKFMQSECSKNKIDFELQVKGNIHYMTNNLISKEDLETLLADHIKNAIIAINHTDNANRSILVKLGKIDETYGLYIYDSGVEFEKETLENLGKKPSTTHKDEGGTGMGFMNTFDTLRKCNASLIIEEFNEPSKDNYTKAIMIKFDNKNEFETKKRVR